MFTFTRSFNRGLLLVLACIATAPLAAQQPREIEQGYPGILVEELVDGLGVPWGMAFLSPQQILVTERAGRVRLLDIKKLGVVEIGGAPEVVAEGQGGLLDVAVGPNYVDDGWIYFTYSKPSKGEAATTLARARLDQNRLVDWQDLLVTDSATDSRRHFGSRITFDDSGHVFFGVGDRGKRPLAQDLSNHIGGIMRLNLDGSVPADNPFFANPGTRAEVWSFGHRNPQGLVFDTQTSSLWEIEHGPRGGDEINLVEKARNYGWPVISHGKEYWGPVAVGEGTSKPGMEQPRKVYIPSIAPGSLVVYRGDAFPEWRGDLFTGALKLRHLNRIKLSESGQAIEEERILEDLGERIRALAISPEGWIYFSTDSGRIMRILPEE
ncbi:MAG: PQQ-dependent sugar dehydrogenase [Gammaproteobacteria bacterium]|nr:PQQ-dependent sugar dehydrogenase [Gammaproteobacteria bacterium]